MTKDEFTIEFNELKYHYGFCWGWSCDLLAIADIEVYEKEDDEVPILTIEVDTPYGRAKGIEDIKAIFQVSNY